MNELVNWIEELSMNALPALTTKLFDGWILRFSEGYTNRANSINPIYESTYELSYKINYCERKYLFEKLPVIYKLTENSNKKLDEALSLRKYEYKNESKVMTMALSKINISIQPKVNVLNEVDDIWLKGFYRLANINSRSKQNTAGRIINNIQNDLICAYIKQDGIIIACGFGVVERGFIGLFDINVDIAKRRRGFGKQICNSILREGIKLGAYMSYLQVSYSNNPAIGLYKKLGFNEQYKYWYRVKV